MRQSCAVIELRLSQARRRAPHLAAVLDPAREELSTMAAYCERVVALLRRELRQDHIERNEKNRGEKDGHFDAT
jgi:hypothetical protein